MIPRVMRKVALTNSAIVALILFLSTMKGGIGYLYWDHLFKTRPELQMMDIHAGAGEAFAQSFRGQFRDSIVYAVASESLAEGKGWLDDRGRPTSFVPPVAPLFYAPFVAFFGYSYKAFWIAMVTSCFLTALLLWRIASRLDTRFGWATMAVFFFHPRLFLIYGLPHSEPPFFLILALMMWLFCLFWEHPRTGIAVALALVTSASVLCRGVTLIFGFLAGIIIAWRGFRAEPSCSRLVRVAGLYLCAFLLPLGIWSWRNHVQLKSFAISTGSQVVMFVGNNPSYNRWKPWWIFEEKHFTEDNLRYAEAFGFKRTDTNYYDPPSGDALVEAAKHYIRNDPINYASLTISRFWTYLAPFHPQMSRVAQLLTASTWLFFATGIAFSIRFRAPVDIWRPELAAFVVPLAFCLIGLQSLLCVDYQFRYRLPLEFLLVPAVAAGWYNLLRRINVLHSDVDQLHLRAQF
jgi:hypothetical protein